MKSLPQLDLIHRADAEGRFDRPLATQTYKIVDVGGQRSERRKWVNVFSSVNAILFVASLAGYDECLLEDRDANQMRESMVVFSQLVSNPLFQKTCIGAAIYASTANARPRPDV